MSNFMFNNMKFSIEIDQNLVNWMVKCFIPTLGFHQILTISYECIVCDQCVVCINFCILNSCMVECVYLSSIVIGFDFKASYFLMYFCQWFYVDQHMTILVCVHVSMFVYTTSRSPFVSINLGFIVCVWFP